MLALPPLSQRRRLAPLARALILATALCAGPAFALSPPPVATAAPGYAGIIGLEEALLTPQPWISGLPNAHAVILDRAAIDAQNARMRQLDASTLR